MKHTLANLSETELENLVHDIDQKKPWRTLDYVFLFFLRRWTLTIGSSYALVILPVPPLAGLGLFLLAVAVDVFVIPQIAWDLRQSFQSQLSLLKTCQPPARSGFIKAATGILLFSLLLAVLLYFSRAGALVSENISYLAFGIMFCALFWMSASVPKYKVAFDCRLMASKDEPKIMGASIFAYKAHPFLGIIPSLNPCFLNGFTLFFLCLVSSTLVLGVLAYAIFESLTNPHLSTPLVKEVFVVFSSTSIFLLILSIYGRMTWWIKLHKAFDLRKK